MQAKGSNDVAAAFTSSLARKSEVPERDTKLRFRTKFFALKSGPRYPPRVSLGRKIIESDRGTRKSPVSGDKIDHRRSETPSDVVDDGPMFLSHAAIVVPV